MEGGLDAPEVGGDGSLTEDQQAARRAVEQSFAMPLRAAGFSQARVVARFAAEGEGDPSQWDVSISYEDALKEAERRRAQRQR